MFRKPFKIKSNNQVKASDRKNIRTNLLKSFPTLTENDLNDLLAKKDVINCIKILTANNETIQIYTIGKVPMVFDIHGKLFPTVYLLWKYPNLLYGFTTHPQVMSFISSGADLMLPGVVTPPPQTNLPKYGSLNENDMAYVNLTNNIAAVAVGVTAKNSTEMLSSNGKGKCLTIYHYFGDKLCSIEGIPNLPLANLGPPSWLQFGSYNDDFPELGANKTSIKDVEISVEDENVNHIDENDIESLTISETTETVPEPTELTTEDMDNLLTHCFFVAIKYSKTLVLPILTSNFYKLQMIPVCSEGKNLDLKKSSFKKLKPFLDYMCKEGVITVKEVKKGVETITAINTDHPKFTEFYLEPSLRPRKDESEPISAAVVTETYIITPSVLDIFSPSGFNKGDTIQLSELKKHIVNYVKVNNCQVSDNNKLVQPKEALVKICKTENKITWEELMEKVCAAMKSFYKVSSGNEEVVNKGKISPITMAISQRSGNKKVTLVDNLELFGIKIAEFAKECQHGVAASTSISRPPGKKCDQLLVQGNQILFIYSLLQEKYKIPQKYIRGLENAPKKRK